MKLLLTITATALSVLAAGAQTASAQTPTSPPIPSLTVQWDKPTMVSRSTPTLQVVGNPMLRRGATMHNGSFDALHELNADYVRYVPWFPYPKLAVAELNPRPTRKPAGTSASSTP